MAANPRQELYELLETLSDAEVGRLLVTLHRVQGSPQQQQPRPLTNDDILLPAPLMPNDETADEMIATVRRWRREGGNV